MINMNIKGAFVYAIVLAAALIAHAPGAFAGQLRGAVESYKDGDGLFFKPDAGQVFELRLAGVDAPETHKSKKKPGQPGAEQAAVALRNLTQGKSLTATCKGSSYGRQVCSLHDANGVDIGQQMAQLGWAHAWPDNKPSKYSPAELAARLAKRGVWAGSPIHPAQWRKACWEQGYCPQAGGTP